MNKPTLHEYMENYVKEISPNIPLIDTLRWERTNLERHRSLLSQAEGIKRIINDIRLHPPTDGRYKYHTLTKEQEAFLTQEGFKVYKSDRMRDGEDCYYIEY